jgi:SAM-dependent methyltransferase
LALALGVGACDTPALLDETPSAAELAGLSHEAQAMLVRLREEALHPDELVRRLQLRPDATVADIGAGPGFFSARLARAVPRGRVIATDLDERSLAFLERRAERAHLGNLEVRRAVADRPGLDEGSLDLAFLSQVDHALADRTDYFSRLRATLRPGGRIAIVNSVRYRDANLASAAAAGLRVVDEWRPTRPFTVLLLAPQTGECPR